jgi:DNA-binding CsgD family transcriptional regulator
MALSQLAAMGAAVVLIAVEGSPRPTMAAALTAFVIALGITTLRSLAVRRRLAASTLVLDAIAMVILLASTGGAGSAFYVIALAGAWWAANVPRPHSGRIYAIAFLVGYLLIVGPEAMRAHALGAAAGDAIALVVVAILSDRFVRIDQRALEINEALQAPQFGAEQVAVRRGLMLALPNMDIPIDVVLAAGRMGLTAIQAELLSYLVMGLTNLEIADATGLSEAAVRYRLTKLYRTLDVRGRREAADRARELGLSAA